VCRVGPVQGHFGKPGADEGAAETYAWAQVIIYTVVRSKSTGRLGFNRSPCSTSRPTRPFFDTSGGGPKAADEQWEKSGDNFESRAVAQ